MNLTLEDEIFSINSIYGPGTLKHVPAPDDPTSLYVLKLPLATRASSDSAASVEISLRLAFPPDYPDSAVRVIGTQSVGGNKDGAGRKVVERAAEVLQRVYRPGEPCVFDLIEESRDETYLNEGDGERDIIANLNKDTGSNGGGEAISHQAQDESTGQASIPGSYGEEPLWTLSEPVMEKKSVFLARAAHVTSTAQAKAFVAHLLHTDKKAARATHNITAWRIRGAAALSTSGASSDHVHAASPQTAFQDCDDDGETAAGSRLLHLMTVMDVWDIMVVVTRWYGGVHLGPDRFRIINSVARDAMVKGGFAKGGASRDGHPQHSFHEQSSRHKTKSKR